MKPDEIRAELNRAQKEEFISLLRSTERDGIEKLKESKKTGDLTEDDLKIAEKKMQDLTDKFCKEIDTEAAAKEKEIMEL